MNKQNQMTTTPTDQKPPAKRTDGSHWYRPDGTAFHFIAKADGSGNRPTTLADAKKLGLLPSVTGILKSLAKPALQEWLIRQSVMAIVTAPDVAGEAIDAKITRILETERHQDEEAKAAADLGTRIHAELEAHFMGQDVIDQELQPWVTPAIDELHTYGKLVSAEKIVVGDGYAGRMDLWLESEDTMWLWDAKSAKKLPDPKKGAWLEHRLQLAAYAQAVADLLATGGGEMKTIKTANIYISTTEKGAFVVCEHDDWRTTYLEGFSPLVTYWQFANNYRPQAQGKPVSARAVAGQVRAVMEKQTVVPETAAAADEPPTSETPSLPTPKNAAGKKVVWSSGVASTQPAP